MVWRDVFDFVEVFPFRLFVFGQNTCKIVIDEVDVEHEWLFLQAKGESVVAIYPGPGIEITFVHLEVKNPVSTAVCGENKTRHIIASLSKH